MKRYEETYLVEANGEGGVTAGMFLEMRGGVRWTSDKARAFGFPTVTNALGIIRDMGLREGEVNVAWHRIEIDVPAPVTNVTNQTISIRKAKVFRADGRIEEI